MYKKYRKQTNTPNKNTRPTDRQTYKAVRTSAIQLQYKTRSLATA